MVSRFAFAMFLSVVIASISQVLLKKSTFNTYDTVVREYLNPYVISGYGLLFLSMLLTVYAYSGKWRVSRVLWRVLWCFICD